MEVASGVHRIPLPLPLDGLRAVNIYAIEDGGRIVLIDSGSPHPKSVRGLEQGLESIGAGVADVGLVLASHAHYDHYGLASRIRAESGATVALGERDLPMLSVALERDKYDRWREQRRKWLGRHGAATLLDDMEQLEAHEPVDVAGGIGLWEPPDRLLQHDEVVELQDRELQVRWTPGHTRGHSVFLDAGNELLFAGDHVLPHITPSLGLEPFSDGRALELFLQSLVAVRDLEVRLVLPGHGPVFADLAKRVDELLAHHDQRLECCVAAVSNGGPR